MLSDVQAYAAAKARLEDGEDELIPLEIIERRLRGEPALRIWREYRRVPHPSFFEGWDLSAARRMRFSPAAAGQSVDKSGALLPYSP